MTRLGRWGASIASFNQACQHTPEERLAAYQAALDRRGCAVRYAYP
jgi:hypothetical protein